ncbi:transmembrane protein 273 [Grus japonensis]|uniref:Transmembrane protein 273 n=2 Tax=Grus TaxID=9114 RepID=A0ABC9X4X3_GRUJA
MTLLTSWISVLMALLLLLHIWRAKVYASGNSEEEIDFTYVIIGATLGAFLAIGFVAVIICMIKKQMIDNVFEGEVTDFVMAAKFNIFNDDLTLTPLMIPHPSLQAFAKRSNMGSSQNRDVNVLGKQSTNNQ